MVCGAPDSATALANHPDVGCGRLRWAPSLLDHSRSSRVFPSHWRLCRCNDVYIGEMHNHDGSDGQNVAKDISRQTYASYNAGDRGDHTIHPGNFRCGGGTSNNATAWMLLPGLIGTFADPV